MADGKAQRVELTKDADEWFRDVAVDDELPECGATVEPDVREREKPQVRALTGQPGRQARSARSER